MPQIVVFHSYNSKATSIGSFGNKVAYNNMVMNIDFTRKLMYNNATKGELDISGNGLIGKKINHDKYFTKSNSITKYITNEGVLDFGSQDSKRFIKEFDEATQLGMTVVSFDEKTSEQIKLLSLTENELYEKIKPHIDQYFEMNNLIVENLLYNFSFHSDKNNFHFHLDFIEKNDTRTNLSMSTKSFNYLKREIMNIVSPDYNLIRKEMLEKLDFYQRLNIVNLKEFVLDFENDKEQKKAFHLIKQEPKIPRYYGDIKSNELKHIIKTKYEMNKILAPEYLKLLNQYAKFSEQIMGATTSSYVENKLKEFEKKACNEIYRQLKQSYIDQFNNEEYMEYSNNEYIEFSDNEYIEHNNNNNNNNNNNEYMESNIKESKENEDMEDGKYEVDEDLNEFYNDFFNDREIDINDLYEEVENFVRLNYKEVNIGVLIPTHKKSSSLGISRRESQSKRDLEKMEYLIYEGMEFI